MHLIVCNNANMFSCGFLLSSNRHNQEGMFIEILHRDACSEEIVMVRTFVAIKAYP